MRQILTILLAAAASPALAGEPVRPTPPAKAPPETVTAVRTCDVYAPQYALAPREATPGLKRLGDLPPANMELTVNRRIDGCPVPVIVRYDVDERRANGLFH